MDGGGGGDDDDDNVCSLEDTTLANTLALALSTSPCLTRSCGLNLFNCSSLLRTGALFLTQSILQSGLAISLWVHHEKHCSGIARSRYAISCRLASSGSAAAAGTPPTPPPPEDPGWVWDW